MANLTTVAAVANYLAVTLTTPQTTEATALLPAVDAAVQTYCDRNWLGGPILNEVYLPEGPLLYLRQRPVASVESVVARWYFATPPLTLTAGSEYLVRDLTRGLLLLSPWRTGRPTDRPYDTLEISYTPVATVPADVALAATILLADLLQPALGGGLTAPRTPVVMKQAGDLKKQYAMPAALPNPADWPAAVQALLRPYRSALVLA